MEREVEEKLYMEIRADVAKAKAKDYYNRGLIRLARETAEEAGNYLLRVYFNVGGELSDLNEKEDDALTHHQKMEIGKIFFPKKTEFDRAAEALKGFCDFQQDYHLTNAPKDN